MGLTNFQITQLFVIFTTFCGIAAIILSIFILCKMWCNSIRHDKSRKVDEECQCHSDVIPDSIEFARGVKLSSTLRTDSAREMKSTSTLRSDSVEDNLEMKSLE